MIQERILDSLTIEPLEKLYLLHWIEFCQGTQFSSFIYNWWYYWINPVQVVDDFEGCYDDNYNLTTLGLEKQNAAMVAQYEQSLVH